MRRNRWRAGTTPQVSAQFSPVSEFPGVEKSAIYRIWPDNTVETLWSSKDENVYDLAASRGQFVFSTDSQGGSTGLRWTAR